MPPAKTKSSDLSKGDDFEMRVARLWFWEGHYARNGIDLRHHFHPEPLLVTDLDLLAYDFSPVLVRTKSIGEAKSGTGSSAPKALDRIVWMRGLMELVGADHAEFAATKTPSDRAKELARSLGIRAQSEADIARRERAARIADVMDVGAHGAEAFVERRWVHKHCTSDQDLERAYWFLRSEVWFLDPLTAAKRLLGLYGQLARKWTPEIADDDMRAVRWLLAETVSVFTMNTVTVAADAVVDDPKLLARRVGERLSAGHASADAMRRIAKDVDKYVAGLLALANASAEIRANAVGAMHPTAPDWTEQYVDLLIRISSFASRAQLLPRQVDVLVHERIVRRRDVTGGAVLRLGLHDPDTGRLVRTFAAFLRSHASVDVVDRALTAPLRNPSVGPEPGRVSEQAALPGIEGSDTAAAGNDPSSAATDAAAS